MAIDQSISQFPPAPDSGSDTPEEFSAKADAFVSHQSDVYTDEVNTWADEANTTASEVNNDATSASSSASAAAASESAASASETNAANSATSAEGSKVAAEDAAFVATSAANYKGEWDNATAYVIGESVSVVDQFYLCKQDNTGMDPASNPDYWIDSGDAGSFVRKSGDTMSGDLVIETDLRVLGGSATHGYFSIHDYDDESIGRVRQHFRINDGLHLQAVDGSDTQIDMDLFVNGYAVWHTGSFNPDDKADEADLTAHTGNVTNPHTVTKAQVGLGSADNTPDVDKPISTATQSALDVKIGSAQEESVGNVINNMISMTQAEYDALTVKEPTTMYVIVG